MLKKCYMEKCKQMKILIMTSEKLGNNPDAEKACTKVKLELYNTTET